MNFSFYYRLEDMFSNLSTAIAEPSVNYPIFDSNLPFADYIAQTRKLIENRREDLADVANPDLIIDANCPYELKPTTNQKIRRGALLIHGLLDSPFSLRDIGTRLQEDGFLCRSILLPGDGTTPSDALHVTYHDWIQAVRYGIESLRKDVDEVHLVGYSTGAALSVYHALQDDKIKSIILLAPAIKIKDPIDTVVSWHHLMKLLAKNKQWICREKEIDYAKYSSISFNAVMQVAKLTEVISDLHQEHKLKCPMFIVVSREDQTISSNTAIDFFHRTRHPESRILLYSAWDHRYPDERLILRKTDYSNLRIEHFSHVAIPFAPNNPHYGQLGDYALASHLHNEKCIYGAYNLLEIGACNLLQKAGLMKYKRQELSYNPDFEYMAEQVKQFIRTIA